MSNKEHDPIDDNLDVDLSPQEEQEIRSILSGQADFIIKNQYHPLEFESIAEFLYFFDVGLTQGGKRLSAWQTHITDLIGKEQYDLERRLRLGLVTCNGSGKDAYIITGTALFLCCCRVRHRVVITTSSYTQLKNQTQNYIRTLAAAINTKLEAMGLVMPGKKALIIKRDHIVCTLTGSEIIMFVTNEEGRGEGYHPFPDNPKSRVTIIVNEAKTVPDIIFGALRRCTFTRFIMVSSPGTMGGYFYNFIQRARAWRDGYELGKPIYRRITAYDCDHIPNVSIEEAIEEMGESHPLFRSMYLAEFVSDTSQIIIPKEWIDRLVVNPPKFIKYPYKQYGIDLSAGGGAETAVYKLEGNKITKLDAFHSPDTNATAARIVELLRTDGASADNVFVDDGGVGRSIIDKIHELGWRVNRVLNQSPAVNKAAYGNRGAENWFNVRRIIEEGLVILPNDDTKLESQLGNRHYTTSKQTGKIICEAKEDARSNGRPSPDRADAVMLCFMGLRYEDFTADIQTVLEKRAKRFQVKDSVTRYDPAVQVQHIKSKLDIQGEKISPTSRFGDSFLVPINNNQSQESSSCGNPVDIYAKAISSLLYKNN